MEKTYINEKQDHDNSFRLFYPVCSSSDLGYGAEKICLPLPPLMAQEMPFEMEIYARFMRHLRHVPNSRADIKVLSSIQFTADLLDHGDALVAKILVDLGLRAPRSAFPVVFLDFVDKTDTRKTGGPAPSGAVFSLKEYWDRIGGTCLAKTIPLQHAPVETPENIFVNA